jgi:uncharacterized C2H2 Zn-finger protein
MPKPKITAEGKFKCPEDDKEYNSRADYDKHCQEEHSSSM